jgi:hypothetical protein
MMGSASTLSVRQARLILGLDDKEPTLDKYEIQKAFVRVAKTHHPDWRHHNDAIPCPRRFQQAIEAKEILLSHHCARRSSGVHKPHSGFAQGFPTRKLRVLTLRQNLALRGVVLTTITFGVLYDEWSRNIPRIFSEERDEVPSQV